jgi:hypothetical protein
MPSKSAKWVWTGNTSTDMQMDEHDRLLHNAQRKCNILHTKQIEARISRAFVRRDHIWL